jgi:peptidoglycan/xylan/chitin deacetylase (PgdA/CDA1 family)
MDWDMVRVLHTAGHAIAAHTVTHPLLANCDADQQRQELVQSKARLEAVLGARVDAFSYPVGIPGSFSEETAKLVQQAGYRWAFSFQGGYIDGSRATEMDAYRLPRVAMETGLSPSRFQALQTLPSLFA